MNSRPPARMLAMICHFPQQFAYFSARLKAALRALATSPEGLGVSYRFPWHRLTDEHLLDLRICDLATQDQGLVSRTTHQAALQRTQ